VLKELADLENPMQSQVGSSTGPGGLFEEQERGRGDAGAGSSQPDPEVPEPAPIGEPKPREPTVAERDTPSARPDERRRRSLPTVEPDPTPGEARSRFDPDSGIVFYNPMHIDYLLVKNDENGLLDYLATLVAKEYVVYNNPRAMASDLGEEMVRMIIRVRRHLPKRR
jgi:hypothetical protein